MEGFCYSSPYVDPNFESLVEQINPPRVCIDNDTYKDCTLIKVDSAHKHGILLELVQILTDLDLFISKSYICSDGAWFMDIFHVTDQFGLKITDEFLIDYIQQAICKRKNFEKKQIFKGKELTQHLVTKHTALEMTVTDQPGLLSEVSAVLADLGCHVSTAVAWTHKHRGAIIFYVDDQTLAKPMSYIQEQLQVVVEAHLKNDEKQCVRLTSPPTSQTHTERRLHQLMVADEDYKTCGSCGGGFGWEAFIKSASIGMSCECSTHVSIDSCAEKAYSVISIRSRDRPKLLFDTVCALTDMQYLVFHAAISTNSSVAAQEYYVRRKDGCISYTDAERRMISQCIIAAVERRVTQGLRIDITAKDKLGLLSDITRVFRENGLSILRAEMSSRGEEANGTFYVRDASGRAISRETLDAVKGNIDWNVKVHDQFLSEVVSKNGEMVNRPSLFSLGSSIWSTIERFSRNFGVIK